MIMKKLLSTTILLTMFSTLVFAEDMSIEMLNKRDDGAKMVYSEDIARIDVGDTITWLPTNKGHNVEFKVGPEGWKLPKKSKNKLLIIIALLLTLAIINLCVLLYCWV